MPGARAATSLAVLSFLGFDAISTLAEETKDPRRMVGKATVTALLLVGSLFILPSRPAFSGKSRRHFSLRNIKPRGAMRGRFRCCCSGRHFSRRFAVTYYEQVDTAGRVPPARLFYLSAQSHKMPELAIAVSPAGIFCYN